MNINYFNILEGNPSPTKSEDPTNKLSVMKKLRSVIILSLVIFQLNAQEQAPSPILFIYDASGSMWGEMDGKTKKDIASEVLSKTVNNLPSNQNVGLMAYGHRKKGDCNDVEYMVALNNASKDKIVTAVKSINPLGRTPLAKSATMAINSLRENKTRATIILVTDGIESCDGDICQVVSAAKTEGIDFKLHIVGFGLKEGEEKQLKCAAEAGDGNYYDAANAGGLGEVLTEATAETIDDSKDNYSIFATKNGEAVDAWVRAYAQGSDKSVDVARTYRDSAFIYLSPGKYRIDVRPLENTKITGTTFSVEMKEGETGHKTVAFDGGKITLNIQNNGEGWDATVRVKNQENKSVATKRTYGREQFIEIDAGVYTVEILALKAKGLEVNHTVENVEVTSGETTEISHNFQTGIANIGISENGELVDTTISIVEATTNKNVAAGRSYTSPSSNPREFILTPGNYKVKLGGKKAGKYTTKWFDIVVKPGESMTKIYEW